MPCQIRGLIQAGEPDARKPHLCDCIPCRRACVCCPGIRVGGRPPVDSRRTNCINHAGCYPSQRSVAFLRGRRFRKRSRRGRDAIPARLSSWLPAGPSSTDRSRTPSDSPANRLGVENVPLAVTHSGKAPASYDPRPPAAAAAGSGRYNEGVRNRAVRRVCPVGKSATSSRRLMPCRVHSQALEGMP